MEPILEGLIVTVVGMGVVYLSLVVLMVAIIIIQRLFPEKGV